MIVGILLIKPINFSRKLPQSNASSCISFSLFLIAFAPLLDEQLNANFKFTSHLKNCWIIFGDCNTGRRPCYLLQGYCEQLFFPSEKPS